MVVIEACLLLEFAKWTIIKKYIKNSYVGNTALKREIQKVQPKKLGIIHVRGLHKIWNGFIKWNKEGKVEFDT